MAATDKNVGVIFFPDFFSNAGGSARIFLKQLSSTDYQSRLPTQWSTVLSDNAASWTPTASSYQNIITDWANAGIGHFAYLYRAVGNSGRVAWDGFQAASNKADVPWCWIITASSMGTTGNYAAILAELVPHFQQAHYLKVDTNRPVLYILWRDSDITSNWGGSAANFKACIDDLRAAAIAASLGDPYIVVIETSLAGSSGATTVSNDAASIAADAIGAYGHQRPTNLSAAYTDYTAIGSTLWTALATKSEDMVPPVVIGRDDLPRRWAPSTLDDADDYEIGLGHLDKVTAPTDAEMVTHITAASDFIDANPTKCPEKLMLIYAATELTESGPGLVRTVGNPTGTWIAALDAILNP